MFSSMAQEEKSPTSARRKRSRFLFPSALEGRKTKSTPSALEDKIAEKRNVPRQTSAPPRQPCGDFELENCREDCAESVKYTKAYEENPEQFLLLVKEELVHFQASIQHFQSLVVSEIHASKAETLAMVDDIHKFLQTLDIKESKAQGVANVEDIHKLFEVQERKIEATLSKAMPVSVDEDAILVHEEDDDTGDGICQRSASEQRGRLAKSENLWADVQESIENFDISHKSYKNMIARALQRHSRSLWHDVSAQLGMEHLLPRICPQTRLAKAVAHPVFLILQTLLILSNTTLLAYEADVTIKSSLSVPRRKVPDWYSTAFTVFDGVFIVEVVFRMFALRLWFFCEPREWAWNWLDLFVVTISLMSDLLQGAKLNYIRALRCLRAVRVARLFRVLRVFRELRKVLFSIMSSIAPFFWCFVFLDTTMAMFSVFLLQGLAHRLDTMDQRSEEYSVALDTTKKYFSSLNETILSLTAGFTGGTDWLELQRAVVFAGYWYSHFLVFYLLFLVMGVTNVLTGLFVVSVDEITDHTLVGQNSQILTDGFITEMLSLFREFGIPQSGQLPWTTFMQAIKQESVLNYFQAYDLEPTHARLVFDLLDEDGSGEVPVQDFILGLLRLKGEAKAIDVRIIQRELGMLPKVLGKHRKEFINALSFHPGNA